MLGLFNVMQPRVGDEVVPRHLVPLLKLAELRIEPINSDQAPAQSETCVMHGIAWGPQVGGILVGACVTS